MLSGLLISLFESLSRASDSTLEYTKGLNRLSPLGQIGIILLAVTVITLLIALLTLA